MRGLEVHELARRHEHAGLERADALVVRADGLVELVADVAPMRGERRDAVVELPAELRDFLRVQRERLLAPAERDVRSSAISVVGVASTTFSLMPASISDGSCCSAAL